MLLLTAIEDPTPYLCDPAWVAQPKYDGVRVQLTRGLGLTRSGMVVTLPWERALEPPSGLETLDVSVVDGELVGDRYIAFDLLEVAGQDLRQLSYQIRLTLLTEAIQAQLWPVDLAITARTTEEKQRMFVALVDAHAEGIVFRRGDAWYEDRRSETALKYKFVSTLTAQVVAHNTQRSVQVALAGPAGLIPVGDVSIPPNRDVPAVGSLIEVRYLYVVSQRLVQPVYVCPRTDVPVDNFDIVRRRGARA